MKKFLLTLAAVALACSAMMAQTNVPTPVQEEPDRIQNRHLSKNPTGMDMPTGYDKAQTVADKKDCCKDKKEGQACNKPADQQCPDCKAKAAAAQQCKKAEGMKCDKAAAGHECKKAEAKKDCCKDKKKGQACNKPADQQCPDCKAKAAAKKN